MNNLHLARAAIVSREPHQQSHRTYQQYRAAVDRWVVELKTIDRLIQLAGEKR